ncbi:MAG: type II toxin-antitoxin system Phd/YefM family antitoxin, partial [Mycobacterium sp.]
AVWRLCAGVEVATFVAMSVEPQMALKDVKNRLSEVVDQVEREHDRVVITKHGRPAAVVLSLADLDSLEETLDIMGRPKLIAQIRDSLPSMDREPAQVLSKDETLALRG